MKSPRFSGAHGEAIALTAGLLVTLGVVWACGAAEPVPPPRQPQSPPTSPWGDNFTFSWDPPAGDAKPLGLTIAVVAPDFPADCGLSDDLKKTYKKVLKGYAHSMALDLDRVLVAKGVRVTGPFDTFSDMTYAEKQSADLALTPTVCIRSEPPKYDPARPIGSGGVTDYIEKPFNLEVEVVVSFVLKEPLSEQKLWVKKLNLDEATERWVEAYKAVPRMTSTQVGDGFFQPVTNVDVPTGIYDTGEILYDGKQDAMANIIKKAYPTVMGKAWTYLDTDEMASMKPTVEEIRKKSTVIQH